jgi:hypothetical protein
VKDAIEPVPSSACAIVLKNSTRANTGNGDKGYPRNTDDEGMPAEDTRFVESNIPVKAIATSSGQNDGGVFELGFRDERYLPFEGAGAISDWSIELFTDLPANNPVPAAPDFGRPLRQFDYGSITDAILHVKYTAREDAGLFKNGAITHLRGYLSEDGTTPLLLALDLRRDFATQWSRFLHPTNPATGNVFELEMTPSLFPIRDAGKTLKINTVVVLARCTDPGTYKVTITPPAPGTAKTVSLGQARLYGGLHAGEAGLPVEFEPTAPPETWRLKMQNPSGGNLTMDPIKKVMEVEDVALVVGYQWE